MSRAWPVNAFKKFNFFQTQLEVIQEHLSSYRTFQKHTNSEVQKKYSRKGKLNEKKFMQAN